MAAHTIVWRCALEMCAPFAPLLFAVYHGAAVARGCGVWVWRVAVACGCGVWLWRMWLWRMWLWGVAVAHVAVSHVAVSHVHLGVDHLGRVDVILAQHEPRVVGPLLEPLERANGAWISGGRGWLRTADVCGRLGELVGRIER